MERSVTHEHGPAGVAVTCRSGRRRGASELSCRGSSVTKQPARSRAAPMTSSMALWRRVFSPLRTWQVTWALVASGAPHMQGPGGATRMMRRCIAHVVKAASGMVAWQSVTLLAGNRRVELTFFLPGQTGIVGEGRERGEHLNGVIIRGVARLLLSCSCVGLSAPSG